MSDVNVVILQGRLGADPVEFTMKGKERACHFSICWQYRKISKAHWYPCLAVDAPAIIILDDLGVQKGDLVCVQGGLKDSDPISTCSLNHHQIHVKKIWMLCRARSSTRKHFDDDRPSTYGEESPPI